MQFKKFLDIDLKVSNYIILFKNNKIIYDSDLKTFQLDTKFLDIDYKNITFIYFYRQNFSYTINITVNYNWHHIF